MTETRYQDYTSRGSSAKANPGGGSSQKFLVLVASLILGLGLLVGGGWWLQIQLAEIFMIKQPVTVVLVDPQPGSQIGPWIFQLQPDSKKILWLNLSPTTQTELFSGYGRYGVAAVYPLLVIDKRPKAYIQASLGAITGRLVTQVIPWPGLKDWQAKIWPGTIELVIPTEASQRSLVIEPIKQIVKLSWQRIWLNDLSYDARMEAIAEFNQSLSWYWFTQQARFKWQWSSQLSDLIPTAPITADDCPIAVVNASQSQGLAKQIGNILTNTGYEVIRLTAETETIEDSALWLDPNQADNCQTVALSVGEAIPTTPDLKMNAEITARYRAPVVLVVGLDNAK